MNRRPRLDVVAPSSDLVGRSAERDWLTARLEEARGGSPQVVVLRGEAGIGKSRLARALVEEATDRAFTTSIGRFREQSGLPFDAFTGDLFQRIADPAIRALVPDAHAEILSGLGAFGSPGVSADTVTEAQRIAAVREGIAQLVRRAPLLLLVDDLQWGDAASLELVLNLVRLAADMSVHEPTPLLALLVVRDEPGVRELPQLDLIRRETLTSSLTLHGLDELDVSRLARSIGSDDLPRAVVAEITRVTRGNPLFVLALLDQLSTAQRRGLLADGVLPDGLPVEVQGLIGSRITGLSAACQEILTAAAVLGGPWDAGCLQAVTGSDRVALDELLDEAAGFGVLMAAGEEYEFAHPLYERAALATLSASRRRAMHGRIADVLVAAYRADPTSSVMSIAHHLLAAGQLAEPAALLEFCTPAADNAFTACAWAESATYYEASLLASERVGSTTDAERVRLALRASTAWLQSGDPQAARRTADAAIAALGESPSPEALARAWIERLRADLFEPSAGVPLDTGPLEQLAVDLEADAPSVAARAYSNLAAAYWATRRVEEAQQACFRAIELGNLAGEHAVCAEAWVQLATTQWMRLDLDDAVESLRAASQAAVASGDPQKLGFATTRLPLTLAWLGRFDEAERALDDAWRATREVGYTLADGLLLAAQVVIAAARGMYMESDAAADDAVEMGRLTGYQWASSLVAPMVAETRSRRGDDEGTEVALESWAPPDTTPDRASFAWLIRQRGLVAKGQLPARAEVEGAWKLFGSFSGMSADTGAALVVELAADIDEPELVVEPAKILAGLADHGQMFTTTMALFIPRILGIAASASGDKARAEMLLTDAIELASRLRAHAELAQCQFALASVRAHDDPAGALALIETAARSAKVMGLAPLVRRCEALTRQLDAPISEDSGLEPADVVFDGALAATGVAVILFTDIADSVRLTEELGDWAFHDRARALQRALHSMIRRFAGSPVEGIKLGDGVLAEFVSAERAVVCAVACSNYANEAGLPLHIGVHAGDVIRDGGDVFGGAVNIAARICDEAPAGEVFASQTIRDLARTSSNATFTALGSRTLKGVAEPIPLYAVRNAQ